MYALVTGATSKIGNEIAKMLAAHGYHLYLHYHKNDANIEELIKECSHVETYCIQADLSIPTGVEKISQNIHHPIDVLIYNAGNSFYGLITDISSEEIERMIQLHMTSPFVITQKLLPKMINKKAGNIVFISSIWGLTGASCEVLYSMVKGGQNSFVKASAKELAPSGIRVNAVAPGAVLSGMMEQFTEDEKKAIADEIPLGRLATPKEVADTVEFLISDKSTYMTGQILSLNGGWYC